jgi:P27 family predicted phage terminase small subunit
MGARGPLPQQLPANVSRLRGEASHTTPEQPLKAAPLPPSMPEAWLDSKASRWNKDRRRVWRHTVKELDALGILARADLEILKAFVEAVVLRDRVTAELDGQDLVVTDEDGRRARNPNLVTLNQALASVDRLARQLGCSPAARLRMPRPEEPDEDLSL